MNRVEDPGDASKGVEGRHAESTASIPYPGKIRLHLLSTCETFAHPLLRGAHVGAVVTIQPCLP
eukprot:scaffold322510_cov31-Tisochrysis_lutea.AAC.2